SHLASWDLGFGAWDFADAGRCGRTVIGPILLGPRGHSTLRRRREGQAGGRNDIFFWHDKMGHFATPAVPDLKNDRLLDARNCGIWRVRKGESAASAVF